MAWQDSADPSGGYVRPFVEHLDDLRRSVIACGVCFLAGLLVAAPLAPRVVEWLQAPVIRAGLDPSEFLKVLTLTGGLSMAVRVVLWTGLILSMPFMALAAARFIFPGLKRRERRLVTLAAGTAVGLFIVGVSVGYMSLPMALRCLLQVNAWMGVDCSFVDFADYVTVTMQVLIAFGLAFELPVLVFLLGALGFLTSAMLRKTRRHAVVILLVLAMILTPSTDPLTMLVLAVPLVVLHEACMWTLWLLERHRAR